MRGAHDDGSHGSKCLGGLKPTGGAIAGMAQRARGLAAADSRKPSRGVRCHANWLAMINAPATTMSAEKTRKRVLLRSLPSFLDPITTDIRTNPTASGTKASGSSGFPWHLISNAVAQMFRCSVFLRLLTRAMEQHVDTHRFTMQVAAGSSRMNG